MILKDQLGTRIKVSAVTSFYPDIEVFPAQKAQYFSIRLTIGSCILIVMYNSREIRDEDLKLLDSMIELS